MRCSDWISDVFSSDLPALVGNAHAELFAKLFKTAAHAPNASLSFRFIVSQQCRAHRPFPLAATPVTYPLPANEASPSAAEGRLRAWPPVGKIGRAHV